MIVDPIKSQHQPSERDALFPLTAGELQRNVTRVNYVEADMPLLTFVRRVIPATS